MIRRVVFFVVALGTPCWSQVGAGTLFQSIDVAQNPGVTQVGLPGNPSISTNEVTAWSQGEGNGRTRSILNAQTLGLFLGDANGDGLLTDWPNIDALEVAPYAPGTNPSIYDFRFSVATDILGPGGVVLYRSGDIIGFSAIGTPSIVIPRSAFQAALGTTSALNVDGYAELADGSVLVSFKGTGVGTNIINPLNGIPSSVTFTGHDVFVIRPPFGTFPAVLAYRQSDLNIVVSFYYMGVSFTDVVGIDQQPNTGYINNPWDPLGAYANGTRPMLLWTINGDDNVFCWNNQQNPLSQNHNFYAIVGTGQASPAGFTTNGVSNRLYMDALAVGPNVLPAGSRITLDPVGLMSPGMINGGQSITPTIRSAANAGTSFQLVVSTTLQGGQGYLLSAPYGFHWVVPSLTDPLLSWSLRPAIAPFFTTVSADANGTAATGPLLVPTNLAGLDLYFQAFRLSGPFPLSSPMAVRVQ